MHLQIITTDSVCDDFFSKLQDEQTRMTRETGICICIQSTQVDFACL